MPRFSDYAPALSSRRHDDRATEVAVTEGLELTAMVVEVVGEAIDGVFSGMMLSAELL